MHNKCSAWILSSITYLKHSNPRPHKADPLKKWIKNKINYKSPKALPVDMQQCPLNRVWKSCCRTLLQEHSLCSVSLAPDRRSLKATSSCLCVPGKGKLQIRESPRSGWKENKASRRGRESSLGLEFSRMMTSPSAPPSFTDKRMLPLA